MQKRVFEYIQEHQMIEDQDRVVVGVSGGADSVCLLHILLEVQKKISFQIGVVHVNHNLRGEEADADQMFVERLCREHRIEYEVFSFAVGDIAGRQKLTVEEAGRKVRYEAFADFSKRWQGTKTALAHHQNDVAETMIYNLVRGSGIAGLCSVHPVRNQYIRPILCMNRAEVEQYLRERQLIWRSDSSNLDETYMRNRIRHRVIDYLTREVNPKAVEHMADAAGSLYEAEQYLTMQAEEKAGHYVRREDNRVFVFQEVTKEHPVIQKYILRSCYSHLAGSKKDLSREHLEMSRQLFEKQVGSHFDLPDGIRVRRTYHEVVFELAAKNTAKNSPVSFPLVIPGINSTGQIKLECRVLEGCQKIIPEKIYTKWLDYDKMSDNLVLRNRQPGDYIAVCQSGGTKKIKDYFIDAKIPREERGEILLLADGSEILWIIGHRISEKYKVTKETKRILVVRVKGRNIHE